MTVTHDHLDLVLTAGGRYRVHPDIGLDSPRAQLAGAQWTGAGLELPAVLHGLAQAARAHPVTCSGYTPAPVPVLVPLEVVRAARHLEHLADLATDPGRLPAGLATFLRDLIRAAIDRLPGYRALPPTWSRPRARRGRGLAVGSLPTIVRRRLTIVDAPGARSEWETAGVIVLDLPAVGAMASGPVIPQARPDVHVMVDRSPTADEWAAMQQLGVYSVVDDPVGVPWLLDQLPVPVGSALRD